MERLEDHLHLAEEIAREAGRLLRDGADDLRRVNFADSRDVKLEADVASERLIRERLGNTGYPVIGEEIGGDAKLTERYEPYWVVDPLDGTHNYLRGVPLCCVSIGLMRGETPVLGVIYDFNRDEMLSGIVTGGLRLNGQPWTPHWAEALDQASLQTGFPQAMNLSQSALEEFFARIQAFKKVRLIGSAALSLAWVAAGRYDVYYEESIRLWDVAAGLALVQAAGGSIRMQRANSTKPLAYDVWAAGREAFLEHQR